MSRKRQPRTKKQSRPRLWAYVIAIAGLWTLVVAVSLGSNVRQQRQETLTVARTAARTAYEKDVVYRRWNAQYGGVYVPVTDETQPNPYLQNVAERPTELIAYPKTGSASTEVRSSGEGIALTLINPAYMTRQVHELSAALHGVQGHITSLNPIRPDNAPDAWEREALQAFEQGEAEVSAIQELNGTRHMRLMRPLVTEASCLQCHGEQGYEVGEIRGGISVAVPMATLRAAAQKHNRVAWLGHGLLWLVGLTIIGGGGYALQGNVKSLQESEERYRSLIGSIQAAVIVHDADGTIVTVNPAAQQLLGVPEEQLVASSADNGDWHFLREDGTPMPMAAYPVNQVLATEEPVRDLIVGLPDGEADEVTWALVDADPVFDETGQIARVIVTAMDITGQRQVEEALKRSEEQYALALRAANAGSWDWDIRTDELHWSEQIEPLFGFERGAFTGTYEAFLERVHPEDRQHVVDAVDTCLAEEKEYAIEHRIVWPDGTVRWVSETGDVIRDAAGEPIRMLGVVQDITERKRAEQQILQQKNLLETTLASLTHPFFVLNVDDYTIEMANGASLPEGGLPPNATCHALTHRSATPCNTKEHPCPLEEVKVTHEPAKVDHVHYAPDGSPRYVEVYGYPIFDDEGNLVRMIEYTLDVTERKKIQKALAERTAELARSNEELEEFAYIASHDLQEPLRKVQAFGDRLQAKYGDVLEGRGRDYLARMQNAASRMQNLINDLLTYSRVTTKAKPFESVDLNEIVADAVSDLAMRIEETGGRVEIDELPTIEVDRVQMRRVMQNLISNALKFHREDEPPMVKVYGEVVDSVDDPVLDDPDSDKTARIFVEDNGIGFDMAYAEQVFAPFQRLHSRSEYDGTGMGVAICRKIVERHGGDITVNSEPGKGSTFVITLPVQQQKENNAHHG